MAWESNKEYDKGKRVRKYCSYCSGKGWRYKYEVDILSSSKDKLECKNCKGRGYTPV